MSAAERQAVTQEVLDQAHLWRTMAAQKHGVPQYPQPRNTIREGKGVEAAEPVTIPFPQNVTINNPAAKGLGTLAKTAIGAALVGGTLGTGAGVAVLGKSIYSAMTTHTTTAVSDASDPATGDLLRWLHDNGYHLPPGATDG